MKKTLITITAISTLFLAGCENWLARTGLGTAYIEIPCGNKYIHASWKDKDNSIWFSFRPAKPDETFDEQIVFQQSSPLGIMQGKVIFRERKCF